MGFGCIPLIVELGNNWDEYVHPKCYEKYLTIPGFQQDCYRQ